MYEAYDGVSNEAIFKTDDKFRLVNYVNENIPKEFHEDIYVVCFLGTATHIYEFTSFQRQVHVM